jgi:leucyl-tRNA synthetase
VTYAVSFNGKARFNLTVAADMAGDDVIAAALADPAAAKWLEGKQVVKTIFVPKKVVNIVIK